MNLQQYIAQIAQWRAKYGPIPKHTNLTAVSRSCVKCGRILKRMHRHHIANDFFFARLLPDVYARRYVEYHPDDIAKLCARCHTRIHELYHPLQLYLWEVLQTGFVITPEWCEEQKAKFRVVFEHWLSQPKRKRNRVESIERPRTQVRKRRA